MGFTEVALELPTELEHNAPKPSGHPHQMHLFANNPSQIKNCPFPLSHNYDLTIDSPSPFENNFIINHTTRLEFAFYNNPSVSTFYDENLVFVWSGSTVNSSNGTNIYSSRRVRYRDPNGTILSTINLNTTMVNDGVIGNRSEPIVASFDNGQYVIVWHGDLGSPSGNDIYAKCFSIEDIPSQQLIINTHADGEQLYPAVITLADLFMIAWQDKTINRIYARFYESNVYETNETIDCVPRFDYWTDKEIQDVRVDDLVGHYQNTGIAVAGVQGIIPEQDRFFVAWAGQDRNVYVRPFYPDGTPLRLPLRVNKDLPLSDNSRPSMVVSEGKELVITWQTDAYLDNDVVTQTVLLSDFDTELGFPVQEFILAADSFDDEIYPKVATFPGGNFVNIWTTEGNVTISACDTYRKKRIDTPSWCVQSDRTDTSSCLVSFQDSQSCSSGLYMRFFKQNGTSASSFRCVDNQGTVGQNPAVSGTVNGDVAVVWASNGNRNLSFALYQNQPPKWISLDFGTYTLPINGTIGQSYEFRLKNSIVDPEGSLVSCSNLPPKTDGELPRNNFSVSADCVLTSIPPGVKLNKYGLSGFFKVSDFEGKTKGLPFQVEVTQPDPCDLQCVKEIGVSVGVISGVTILAILAYRFREYKRQQYREFQQPFASEVYNWLNLNYSDFSEGPGKEFARIITDMVLMISHDRRIGDITALRFSDKEEDRLRYHYYAYRFAEGIYHFGKSGYAHSGLLRNTRFCGVRLTGRCASREIYLSDLEGSANDIVRTIIHRIVEIPEPNDDFKEAVKKQEEQATQQIANENGSCCRKTKSIVCTPFRNNNPFTLFQKKRGLFPDLGHVVAPEVILEKDATGGKNNPFGPSGVNLQGVRRPSNSTSFFGVREEEGGEGVAMTNLSRPKQSAPSTTLDHRGVDDTAVVLGGGR